MSNTKAILAAALIFVFGIATGAAVTAKVIQMRIHAVMEGRPEVVNEMIVRRLNRKLHLDAAQRTRLLAVIEKTRAQLKEINEKVRPEVKEIFAGSAKEFRTVLTPEQAGKFDAMVANRKEKWALR